MGFISNLFRGRDVPANRTSGSTYSFFMGGSAAGKNVNERSAMQMTAVYSCVRILSEAVAGLPLQFYEYNKDGGKEKAVNHPLYFLLHDEPNPEMTSFVFRETLMTHLLLWGNAYAQIIRNGRGEVIALYPLMADRMEVGRDQSGQIYYEYRLSSEDAHTMKGSTVRLVTISVSFSVTQKWLKLLTEFKQKEKLQVRFFNPETVSQKVAEMYVDGFKAKLKKDTSYKGLWTVSFNLKEL